MILRPPQFPQSKQNPQGNVLTPRIYETSKGTWSKGGNDRETIDPLRLIGDIVNKICDASAARPALWRGVNIKRAF